MGARNWHHREEQHGCHVCKEQADCQRTPERELASPQEESAGCRLTMMPKTVFEAEAMQEVRQDVDEKADVSLPAIFPLSEAVLSISMIRRITRRKRNVCFSATANFVGSGVLGAIGVVTLTRVKHRRELLFASLPTLFAIHQFIEGFVWLGLDGILSPAVTHDMGAAFMLYAQGLLPFLLPMSVILFEPDRKSRRRMLPFLVIGALTTLYILWALTAYSLEISIRSNSIVYINQATNNTWVAVLYVIATCGSLLFSKVKDMVIFGVANMVILLVVMAVKRYAFTSLWCAYAAAASVIILGYFWKSKVDRPFKYGEAIWG